MDGFFMMDDMTSMVWKQIPMTNGRYMASNLGNIRNELTSRWLKPYMGHQYLVVKVSDKPGRFVPKTVHVLVANAFLGLKPTGYEINHIDGNKLNNAANNLEYVTRKQNFEHAVRNGLTNKGELNNNVSLTLEQVILIKRIREETGWGKRKISRMLGVSEPCVAGVLRGNSWGWV